MMRHFCFSCSTPSFLVRVCLSATQPRIIIRYLSLYCENNLYFSRSEESTASESATNGSNHIVSYAVSENNNIIRQQWIHFWQICDHEMKNYTTVLCKSIKIVSNLKLKMQLQPTEAVEWQEENRDDEWKESNKSFQLSIAFPNSPFFLSTLSCLLNVHRFS